MAGMTRFIDAVTENGTGWKGAHGSCRNAMGREPTMRTSSLTRGRWVIVSPLLVVLVLMCRPADRSPPRFGSAERPDTVDDLIRQLGSPEGKVKYLFSVNPGGPVFKLSAPMKELAGHGRAIQPRLIHHLKDPRIRNEIALILERVGDQQALPALIDALPSREWLTSEEEFSSLCLLDALWQLTGIELGIHHKFTPKYTPEIRAKWRAWHDANRSFLYTLSETDIPAGSWSRNRVSVDFEAKFAGVPTTAYRKEHPWITYEEIRIWRDDPAYERKLKDFCFSVLLNRTWNADGTPPRDATRAVGRLQDPRALAALRALCKVADDSLTTHDVVWTLEEKGDAPSLACLDLVLRSSEVRTERFAIQLARLRVTERLRLMGRYGKQVEGKPFDADQQTAFMKCLEGPAEVEKFVARMREADGDVLSHLLTVAGYLDQESVRACLKDMAGGARDDKAKVMVRAALARLGEKDSLEYLRRSLAHKEPGVRLAAAEALWRLGRRDGLRALLDLTGLRPIETGGEGVTSGNGALLKVTAIENANVEHIRNACKILGEMGDRAAVEPLKKLLPLNLSGVLAGGGSGTGWPGRPDVVALAKLGDFSGIEVLRGSIRKGDRLEVVGSWGGPGDFVEIGLKRFIPDLLPLLTAWEEDKRVLAAQAVLLLLERGT
jgi:HEAT repeat protein